MEMTLVMKWIGLGVGLLAGGVLGYTQVLCPDGQCAISGSWYGGALLGGVLGFWLLGGCPACSQGACRVDRSSQPDSQ